MITKFICYFAFVCEFGVPASYFSKDLFTRYHKPWCEKQSPISFLSQKGSDHYYSIWIDKLMILILFHFIAMHADQGRTGAATKLSETENRR